MASEAVPRCPGSRCAVQHLGASRAGSYAFVSPVIAVCLGVGVFDGVVTGTDVLGMVVMLVSAWLTLRPVEAGAAISPPILPGTAAKEGGSRSVP